MSYYATYSPLFTGTMDSPEAGVQITDYKNFKHICETVHDEWAFTPEIEWREEPDTYPKKQYAYLYGFTNTSETLSQYDECDTWSINKLTPTSPLFNNVWYAVSMTCEPFSVLMHNGSSEFPRTNAIAFNNSDCSVQRLDCSPGCIEQVEVSLADYEETHIETYEWDEDTYEKERFLGGINY